MNFYVLDDMIGANKVLVNIIESMNLGEVIGSSTDSEKGIAEILAKQPDIVIIDLLMPKKDGITVVKEIREINPNISFIMVSQVVDKKMISDAYNAGIEFFITKPNNRIEIEKVIRNVIEKREMEIVLKGIRSVIGDVSAVHEPVHEREDAVSKSKKILGALGMLGESGTKDILSVIDMLQKDDLTFNTKTTLNDYSASLDSDPKIVKQRIRRAVKRGLTNIASIGVEDYYNDMFSEYAHMLFNFDAVRSEMDMLRGKSAYGGSPSIDKFFEGLILLIGD